MKKLSLIALAVCMAAMGCDQNKAAREQEKAAEAQREANERAAKAQNEAVTEITQAQLEANKKINEANADFLKIREDYRHKVQADLTDVDKDIAKLEEKAKTAVGQKKADFDSALVDIRAKRATVQSSFDSLQNATAAGWDAMKNDADKAYNDLKAAIRNAPGVTIGK